MPQDDLEKRVANIESLLGVSQLSTKEPTGELQRVVVGGAPTAPAKEAPPIDEFLQMIQDMIDNAIKNGAYTDDFEINQIINSWINDNSTKITNLFPPPDTTPTADVQTTTILEVIQASSESNGDGLYDCVAKAVENDLWDSELGVEKLRDYFVVQSSYEVLNLLEANVPDTYERGLCIYDLMAGFEVPAWNGLTNAYDITKWVGVPIVSMPRLAIVDSVPTSSKSAYCNLYTRYGSPASSGELGYHITVYANVCDSIAFPATGLTSAANRIVLGDLVYVVHYRGKWYFAETFNRTMSCA